MYWVIVLWLMYWVIVLWPQLSQQKIIIFLLILRGELGLSCKSKLLFILNLQYKNVDNSS